MTPFLPDPPQWGRQARKSAEESFAETVVRQACRQTQDFDRYFRECKRAHEDRTGQKGISTESLSEIGFPLQVYSTRVEVSTVRQILDSFYKTKLYASWVDLDERLPNPGGTRILVFNWVGWGVCGLTNVEWSEEIPTRIIAENAEGEKFMICTWELFVKKSGWSAVE